VDEGDLNSMSGNEFRAEQRATGFTRGHLLLMNRRHSSGQALLITLLVLAVALTAGLSLIARTITDISISEKESASSKAFEAVEAGVEEALRAIEAGEVVPGSLSLAPGGEEADVNITVSEPTGELANREIYSGEATTFWLNWFLLDEEAFPNNEISYSGDEVKLCWSGSDKIEAAVYYQENGYKVARYYLIGGESCSAVENGKEAIIDLPATINNTNNKFINVRFYGDANDTVTVAMEGVGDNLPQQGNLITSKATVGDVVRKVTVFQGWPVPPSFFDFVLFSGRNLSKSAE